MPVGRHQKTEHTCLLVNGVVGLTGSNEGLQPHTNALGWHQLDCRGHWCDSQGYGKPTHAGRGPTPHTLTLYLAHRSRSAL